MKYPLSRQAYDALVADQLELCAICEKDGGKPLVADHDHITGNVRGLLCADCNSGLGFFREDPATLSNAIHYLGESETVRVRHREITQGTVRNLQSVGTTRDLWHEHVRSELTSLARKYNEEAARMLSDLIKHFAIRRSIRGRKTPVPWSP